MKLDGTVQLVRQRQWSPFADQQKFCELVEETFEDMKSWSENSDITFAMARFQEFFKDMPPILDEHGGV